jgi:IPT/TIG domain
MSKLYLLLGLLLSLVLVGCPDLLATSKPVINSLTATPASLPVGGGSSKLEWQLTGADSISIDQGVGIVTGSSKDVNVTESTTYTLTAQNAQGTTTKSVIISVAQIEAPTKISGTISPWTRGARLVKGNVYLNGVSQVVVAGDMNTDGSFNVPLTALPDTSLTPLFTSPGGCASSIISTPATIKIAPLAQFNLVTNAGLSSGALINANTSTFVSSPQAGVKFMFYVYSNQNGTIKGSCNQAGNGSTINFDWTLKQGWNTALVEYISATESKYTVISANAVPADVSWKFIPASGIITITNPISSLEYGNPIKINATAVEPDGTPIANPEFIWTSSNPALVEISTDGVVTAKKVGETYDYSIISVAFKNSLGSGTSLYISTHGLEAVGGTFNLENATLGTATRLRYQAPVGTQAPASIGFTITGPSGWNSDQPFTGTFNPNLGFYHLNSEIPAVSGSYQLQTTGIPAPKVATQRQHTAEQGFILPRTPLQYPITIASSVEPRAVVVTGPVTTTTFTVDTTKKIAPASDLKIIGFQNNSFNVSWGAIPNYNPYASSVYTRLMLEVKDQTTGQIILSNQEVSVSPSSTNTYQNVFDISHTYVVRLVVVQVPQAGELNASRATVIVDSHPEITQLTSAGGATLGGYNVIIVGYNFDANTSVFFGNTEAINKSFQGSSSILVNVPAGIAGTVDVIVSNIRGTSTVSALTKFKYYDVKEFTVLSNNGKLLAANNGVYFVEQDNSHTPPFSLSKIDSIGTIARVWLSDIPASSYARDMSADSTGNIWILTDTKVIRVATNNQITSITLPIDLSPTMIAVGSDGNLWISRIDSNAITRIQTDGSNATTFPLLGVDSRAISFSGSNEMLLAPDGNLWFTIQNGYGKVTPSGVTSILSSTVDSRAMIISDNAVWLNLGGIFTRFNTDGTTATYTDTCYGRLFARASDGTFWCTNGDLLERTGLSGTTGVTQFISLSGNSYSALSDIVSDSSGKLWFLSGSRIGVIAP